MNRIVLVLAAMVVVGRSAVAEVKYAPGYPNGHIAGDDPSIAVVPMSVATPTTNLPPCTATPRTSGGPTVVFDHCNTANQTMAAYLRMKAKALNDAADVLEGK